MGTFARPRRLNGRDASRRRLTGMCVCAASPIRPSTFRRGNPMKRLTRFVDHSSLLLRVLSAPWARSSPSGHAAAPTPRFHPSSCKALAGAWRGAGPGSAHRSGFRSRHGCTQRRGAFASSRRWPATFDWPDARTLRFKPAAPLARDAGYVVQLGRARRAKTARPSPSRSVSTFTRVGFLQVTQVLPAPDLADVEVDATITVMGSTGPSSLNSLRSRRNCRGQPADVRSARAGRRSMAEHLRLHLQAEQSARRRDDLPGYRGRRLDRHHRWSAGAPATPGPSRRSCHRSCRSSPTNNAKWSRLSRTSRLCSARISIARPRRRL